MSAEAQPPASSSDADTLQPMLTAMATSEPCAPTGTSFSGSNDASSSKAPAIPKNSPRSLRLLIVAGPSGVGKGTLVRRLRAQWPSAFGFSVSHTTRQPRPGEQHGREYYFVSREVIEDLRDRGALLEHAVFSGNMYATSVEEVRRISEMGQICLLEIDLVGVAKVRAHGFPGARFVFIEPPSLEVLETRLKGRKTETPEALQKRLNHAREELEASKNLPWDLRLLNNSVEVAWTELRDAVSTWFGLPVETEQ
ncbi:putative guanylate kinase [Cyclospora cayetanensis]|uniref:guanylate kinase n=1 Tax=Cyclospora cayetanensis TaxID=88456 RepID=A0A1D3D1Q2_9EIME|nr:putative guanylate kinase [Cyclospora cayetanensis]